MSAMASHIIGVSIVCWTLCSGANQRKHPNYATLAFVRESTGDRWIPPHKRPVTREIFPFDDIIMSCLMCHFSHSQTNTVVTDGLVSSWYQDIGNDHDDLYRSALVRSIQHKGVVASHVRHKHRLMMTSPNGIFSALLALCAGNSPVTGEFPSQRPVTRSIGVFSDLRLNKRLSKQSGHRWSETPSCSLWHHSNIILRVGWNSFFIVWPKMGNIPLP